ncbi:MAG: histidine kinase [Salinivirgaceae bacterium]
MPLARVLIYLIGFLSTINSFSQEHTHRFYTVYDGLPQSQVTCVVQDCTGYIWAGTKGGVARFDGHKFEAFTEKEGLAANMVYQIIPADSCIWFFSQKGITKLTNNKFTKFKIPNENIYYVGTLDGKMVFNTDEYKNLFFDGLTFQNPLWDTPFTDSGMYTKIEYIPTDSSFIVINRNKSLIQLKKDQAFLIDSLGTYFEYNKNTGQLLYHASEPYKFNEIYFFDIKSKRKIPLKVENFGEEKNLYAYFVGNQIMIKSDHKIGFYNQGKVNFVNKKFNFISNHFIDNQKNIWIADEDGLYFFNKLEFTEYTKQNSLCPSYVWDIKEFPKGKIWFATYGSGLYCLNGAVFKEDLIIKYKDGITLKKFYFNTPPANDSFMILNSTPYPIQVFRNNKYKPFVDIFGGTLVTFYDSIKSEYILSVSEKNMYVKEKTGEVSLFKGTNETFSRNILDISYDKDGDICLGHRGLTKFKNRQFIPYPNIPDTIIWRVFSLQKDHKGNIWIGTDQGLWFYNYDTIFQINTLYFRGYVTFLEIVDTTWLMGGTSLGLALINLPDFYNKGEQHIKFYDRYNGFMGRECGQNGTLHDSENTYWIPTIDRVLRLDPTKIAFNTTPPKVIFKGISLLGENLSWSLLGDSIQKLDYTQNGLKFSYEGLNYSAPERVKFKYRLLGYSDSWSVETAEQEAIFTNLKYGKYSFEILACNEDGYWTGQPTCFNFEIIPAWWQRIWIQLISVFFLIGLLIWVVVFIMKKRAQEQREKLETRNQMLNMSLSTIKNQMDPHFTYNALNGIESLIMKEDRATAYRYLLKLSGLIRNTLNDNDLINRSLSEEIKFVNDYLELEKFRFKDKFEYEIVMDPKVDMDTTVPKLIVQIFVENAIKHGLMHKEREGLLQILLSAEKDRQLIVIQDNGIGRTKAKEYAIHSTGKGLNIIRKLIRIFNEQNSHQITFEIIDLCNTVEEPLGTRVEVSIKK